MLKPECSVINAVAADAWLLASLGHIDGLVEEKRNSSALAMDLRLSSTNPSIYSFGIDFAGQTGFVFHEEGFKFLCHLS